MILAGLNVVRMNFSHGSYEVRESDPNLISEYTLETFD